MSDKPKMRLLGQDGNIFAIIGRASKLLKEAGLQDKAKEMYERVTSSGSYDEALHIVSEYVETELSSHGLRTSANQPTKRKEKNNHHDR